MKFAAVLLLLLAAGCTPDVPVADIEKASQAIKSHYREFPIGGGWHFLDTEHEGNRLYIRVAVASHTKKGMLRMPLKQQWKILAAGGCPGTDGSLWREIHSDLQIWVKSRLSADSTIDQRCPGAPRG